MKMNNSEKVDLVNQVLTNHSLGLCPYCHTILIRRVNKAGAKKNHCDVCKFIIDAIDYFEVIEGIIKYSELKNEPTKFKKLSEF